MYETEAAVGNRAFREPTALAKAAAPELPQLLDANQVAIERTNEAMHRIRTALERLRGSWPEADASRQTNGVNQNPRSDGVLFMLRTQVDRASAQAEELTRLASLLEGAV